MPAKKSSKSTEKTAAKKTATRKAASKKTAVKKTPKAKKQVSKETAKKKTRTAKQKASGARETPDKETAPPTAPEKTAAAESSPGEKRVRKAAALHRDKRHTPPIFRLPSRRQAPIVFTLEDVREHVAKQKKEEEPAARVKTATNDKKVPAAVGTSAVNAKTETPLSGKRAAASFDDILGFGGASATRGGEIPAKWKPYHDLLTELRDSVKMGLMQHSNDTLKRSQKEDAGDISTSADAGTDNFDRDFALSLLSTEQEALKEIEAAIRRIHNGTYGTCEITGEPIAAERLEAVPFTRFSLEGQRQHEANARRKTQRGGTVFAESTADISFGDDDGDN